MAWENPQLVTPMDCLSVQAQNVLFQENCERTHNENLLFNAWKMSQKQVQEMNLKLQRLQNQIIELHKLYTKPKENPMKVNINTNTSNSAVNIEKIEYFTDEKELEKETEWIRVKNRKKRKMDTSLTPLSKQISPNKDKFNP